MFTLNCAGKLISIEQPLVMGIINANDDSFYTGSRAPSIEIALKKATQMVEEGADILDVGGQSTRPGSKRISSEEELNRVLPIIEEISENFPDLIISVDTYYADVALQSVAAGARMINDISGGEVDPRMITTVGKLNVPYVCMHIKGNPETMQEKAEYKNVTIDVFDYFIKKIHECRRAGINDVIIDPGFGFAKKIEHNFSLLKALSIFRLLEVPILAGLSRKSSIYKTLDISAKESLNGSTVMHTLAIEQGANILRVHDVKEAREVVRLLTALHK